MRELVGRELAGQHRACGVELFDGGGIAGRDSLDADLGMAGGANAGRCIDVLKPERDAVQRTAVVPGHNLLLGLTRLLQCLFRRDQQVGVELRIERLDPRKQRLSDSASHRASGTSR
jgi:hypothetical protein